MDGAADLLVEQDLAGAAVDPVVGADPELAETPRPLVGVEEFLIQLLDTDEGARRLGELGIGTNYAIDRGTLEVLLDEKIGGTVHMAVGRSYPESGGVNESAVHTDLVCDLRLGGELIVDGITMQENGKFVV